MDDLHLVEAWRAGDRQAGQALFRRHFQGVTRFFRNKFSAGIDDLVQQTFMALLEGRERLTSGANFRSYLFGIAHNVMRANLRALASVPNRGYRCVFAGRSPHDPAHRLRRRARARAGGQ